MTKILFVDDQENVLSALRRMLHGRRDKWQMQFANSGQEAIELLEQQPFDVVVTDMRMPGIDGAELLARARERWPSTVRIVLSGQSEPERILRSMETTHVYLSKPCDANRLTSVVTQSSILRDRLRDADMKRMVSQIAGAPCQVSVYEELVEKLNELVKKDKGLIISHLELPVERVNVDFLGEEVINYYYLHDLHLGDIAVFSS